MYIYDLPCPMQPLAIFILAYALRSGLSLPLPQTLPTGAVEVHIETLEVLNKAENLPFDMNEKGVQVRVVSKYCRWWG